jgi:hypothetical protein
LREWISKCRLDIGYRTSPLSAEETAALQRFKSGVGPAMTKSAALLRLSLMGNRKIRVLETAREAAV